MASCGCICDDFFGDYPTGEEAGAIDRRAVMAFSCCVQRTGQYVVRLALATQPASYGEAPREIA